MSLDYLERILQREGCERVGSEESNDSKLRSLKVRNDLGLDGNGGIVVFKSDGSYVVYRVKRKFYK